MAAGNRRAARRTTSGEGREWVAALAGNVLGWERDLTEDGDVEARPGPGGRSGGSDRMPPTAQRRPASTAHPSSGGWVRGLTEDGN
eukprot:9892335-Alexandrium_andersonii.AAC.1